MIREMECYRYLLSNKTNGSQNFKKRCTMKLLTFCNPLAFARFAISFGVPFSAFVIFYISVTVPVPVPGKFKCCLQEVTSSAITDDR